MDITEKDAHHAIAWALAKALLDKLGGKVRLPLDHDFTGYTLLAKFPPGVGGVIDIELVNPVDTKRLAFESTAKRLGTSDEPMRLINGEDL